MENDFSRLPCAWVEAIKAHVPYGHQIEETLSDVIAQVEGLERLGTTVFPHANLRFRAFHENAPASVKVVIAGQDCYHGEVTLADGSTVPEAVGLSFSVPDGARLPPSLRNIFKEMCADLGCAMPTTGDLSHWSRQGVLLINAILSVEKKLPKSHAKLGWQSVTGAAIEALSASQRNIVFILWGNDAKALKERIVGDSHVIIESSHPSPIGGSCYKGFFGSKPFSRANEALAAAGKAPIKWGAKDLIGG